MNSKIFKNKNFLSVFLAFIVFIGLLFIYTSELWIIADKNIQKQFYNYVIDSKECDDRIVVVEIDQNTVLKLWRFPFDRKEYIKLIKNLNKAWASVIWLDIIFADKTWSDNEFAKALKDAWNIVIWWWTIKKRSEIWDFEKPRDIFATWSLLVWTFDVRPNSITNIIFSLSPYKILSNWEYEYFWISLLRAYYYKLFKDKTYLTEKMSKNDEYISIKNNIIIPLSSYKKNDILVNFETSSFNRYSFLEIYNDIQFSEIKKIKWDQFLKGKIVIVWATLRWIDTIKTPVWDDYWVYVHANFLNTVFTKNFSKYFDVKLELLLIFLLTTLAIYINLVKTWKTLIISNFSIIGIVIVYLTYLYVLNLVPNFSFELICAILLSTVLSNIAKYIIENKDKTKLNTALSEYVSKDIAEEILSWSGAINLDWDKKRIAIFFSDIEWFTNISEQYSPEKLISFLKEYLTEMSEIIFSNKWFVNKYEWDAIMALRWVFWKEENISKSACDAALLQKQKLTDLNKKWSKKWIPIIKVRIWINSWEAIIWNIWSVWKKLEFTAIWDNVNLASRLESINKFYSTYICVSWSVYEDTKDLFEYRYLDKIKVKWKDNAINVYELLGNKWTLSEKEKELYDNFEKWVNLYLNRNFKKAITIFKKLSNLWDAPSLVYKDRCETFIDNPPVESWDHTWTMTEK